MVQLNKIQKIGITGMCMFIFSILFKTTILPMVLKKEARKKIALKQGWEMRGIWGKIPFAFEFQCYVFNITNPNEIKEGAKPIMQEIGPYIYDEWNEKTNQIDHEEDDSVSFTVRNTFHFNAEKSKGLTGEEEIFVPHLFALATINVLLKDKPAAIPIASKAINSIMKKPDSIFIKVKVKELLFEGINIDCNVTDFTGTAVCNEIEKFYLPWRLKKVGDKLYTMSLMGWMNNTDATKRTRIKRGIKNIMDVGKVIEYDGKPNISIWNDEFCDTFDGTDGSIFHPFFNKKGKDSLVSFNAGLCRVIICKFDSKTKFAGLNLLRYTTDLGIDGNENPQEKCYCDSDDSCLKKGAYNLFRCTGIPFILTNPHFYLADPYYISKVDGLHPVKEKHMVTIDLDPFSGSPVVGHLRAQFNLFITKVDKIKIMANYPDALLPIMWVDEIVILPDFLLKKLRSGHLQAAMAKVFQYLMMIGGLIMSGYAGFTHYKSMQSKKTSTMKPDSNDSKENKMHISTLQPVQVTPKN